jgi:hypothetical protein
MIMHINLNCLWSLGLVPHLTFQIYDLTWEKKMRYRRGQHQMKGGGDDQGITTSDTTTPSIEMQGLIMRSRAQQLHHQVNSFICSSANDLENRLLPNDLIIIRNQEADHGGHVGHQ